VLAGHAPLAGCLKLVGQGIVRAAVRDRQLALTDANDLLRTMIESGFHSPMQRLPV